ncbi:MAG TPA: hypothetical protein VGP45_00060, partial [Marinobacter sp.]|nr:hypothetical protein [Marinobacter sp.]
MDADGIFIQHDLVDDALTVTLPDMGTEATVAYVTRSEVRLLEDQTISGSYTLPTQEIAGFIAIDRALTFTEKVNVIRYLASKVEGVNYGAEIDRLTLIAINAVDVFVYDTSKDSDGGVWRTGALAQGTSWYNETLNTATRGSRREFPAVAVIVAEAAKVTIYDGDDPALPMWMVFENAGYGRLIIGNISSIFMLNGWMACGETANDIKIIDFLGDRAERLGVLITGRVWPEPISGRNTSTTFVSDAWHGADIINRAVNDVAMTVLPDAPIDPATGLPVPTIAVATDGGVSVIKDDGNVWDITFSGGWGSNIPHVKIANENLYFEQSIYYWLKIPFSAVTQDYVIQGYGFSAAAPFVQMMPGGTGFSSAAGCAAENASFELAYSQGNTRRGLLLVGQDKQLQANVTADFTSGWLVGGTRGAWLASASDAALSGAEMVANGGFDADANWGKGAGWSISDGTASADGTQAANSNLQQTLSPVAGKTYAIRVNVLARGGGASAYFYWGTTSLPNITEAGEYTFYYTWSGGSPTLYFTVNAGVTVTIDDISVVEADADRYTANKGLIVNGTITRSPVADGAELVAYSGFSASNYLEQPYNSALDFGTGDFCVMGWATNPNVGQRTFISRMIDGDAGFNFQINAASRLQLVLREGASLSDISSAASVVAQSSGFRFFVGLRRAGVCEVWADGRLLLSAPSTRNITPSGLAGLRVGLNSDGAFPAADMALWRISATAPTPDQIAKIYEDERRLFQPGAQCTLYGTSDAVTALA